MNPRAVWTGDDVILWGAATTTSGGDCADAEGGMAYRPTSDRWRQLPPAPVAGRTGHAAVWTGREMVVWGGESCAGQLHDGAVYDLARRRWTAMPPGPLRGRSGAAGVWTGREILIWGGTAEGYARSDGALFDPRSGTWRAIADAPTAGTWAGGVSTDDGVLLWSTDRRGGEDNLRGRAAIYRPESDTWLTIEGSWNSSSVPVWTGRELIVPNLASDDAPTLEGVPLKHGAYNPSTNRWRSINPGPRDFTFEEGSFAGTQGVWTGREAIFWGDSATAYEPGRDRWRVMSQAPLDCRRAVPVWTGREMIVWGGEHGGDGYYLLDDGLAYAPDAEPNARSPRTTSTLSVGQQDERVGTRQHLDYRCGGD